MDADNTSLEFVKIIRHEWGKRVKSWERKNGRDFSWRENRSPYKVLVSEILLKRTTSTAAARTYQRFLSAYPDIFHLAKASSSGLEDILRDIGLYKQRSKHIKEMAEYLVQKFNGSIPNNYTDLIDVPGIGDYTASAVLVFGYGKSKAVVDSNVIRVISRAFNVNGKNLKDIAETLVPKKKTDIYNYGLLDLGSTVCHYKYVKCEKCPVENYCLFVVSRKI